jgi:regulator of CtrA degradation
LPAEFVDLVTRSLRLQALVRRMDEEIYGPANVTALPAAGRRPNPVSDQITLLSTAFARG